LRGNGPIINLGRNITGPGCDIDAFAAAGRDVIAWS